MANTFVLFKPPPAFDALFALGFAGMDMYRTWKSDCQREGGIVGVNARQSARLKAQHEARSSSLRIKFLTGNNIRRCHILYFPMVIDG